MIQRKESQSTLDFIFVFIAALLLALGITRIWVWFNANYAHRQTSYQISRILAGKPGTYTGHPYPVVDVGRTAECPDCIYEPLDLSEEWLFKGKTQQKVPWVAAGTAPTVPSATVCKEECLGQPGCGQSMEDFNYDCSCYQQCLCRKQVAVAAEIYRRQVIMYCGTDNDCGRCVYSECVTQGGSGRDPNEGGSTCGQACFLRKTAASLRDAAEACDDPWEFCFWATFGTWRKTKKELLYAASKLEKTAAELEADGRKLQRRANAMKECCNKSTASERNSCLEGVRRETLCDTECTQWSAEKMKECKNLCVTDELRACEGQRTKHCRNVAAAAERCEQDCESDINMGELYRRCVSVCYDCFGIHTTCPRENVENEENLYICTTDRDCQDEVCFDYCLGIYLGDAGLPCDVFLSDLTCADNCRNWAQEQFVTCRDGCLPEPPDLHITCEGLTPEQCEAERQRVNDCQNACDEYQQSAYQACLPACARCRE